MNFANFEIGYLEGLTVLNEIGKVFNVKLESLGGSYDRACGFGCF